MVSAPVALCKMVECFRSAQTNMAVTSHVWLLGTWNVVVVTETQNLPFCQILVNGSLRSPVWLVVTILDAPEFEGGGGWIGRLCAETERLVMNLSSCSLQTMALGESLSCSETQAHI